MRRTLVRAAALLALHLPGAAALAQLPPPSTPGPATAHGPASPFAPRPFSFAVIGDAPYDDFEVAQLDRVIEAINRDDELRFTLHVGDVKGGSQRCDDALYDARLRQLQTLRRALVLTPGDNDWTDCHRASAGAYNPLDRLERLRAVFYPAPQRSLGGAPLALATQADVPGFAAFVENTMFVHEGVVFAAVHVVGSNNGLAPWTGIDPGDSVDLPRTDRLAEFKAREAAALDWLTRAFATARVQQAVAVVVFMQANPRLDVAARQRARQGFNAVIARLQALTVEFARPVLLVHGDHHQYFVDRPWQGGSGNARVPRFVRMQTFGSPRVDWVKVGVDPGSPEVFSFSPPAPPAPAPAH